MVKYRYFKYLVVLLIAFSFTLFEAGEWSGRASMEPLAARSRRSADPKADFKKHCARCHGADGSADTESGRIYETPDISGGILKEEPTSKLVRIVTNGKGSMPAFKKKLTPSQINSLIDYMRNL